MNLIKISLLILIFSLSVSFIFAQTKTMDSSFSESSPLPGNIRLLKGYIHTPGRGIDSAIGKISKENGLEISYDIGPMSGAPALGALVTKEKFLWIKEQEIDGQKFVIAFRKDGVIYANINYLANFMSVIKTNEDLADFLMMIMTYGSKDEKETTPKKQQKFK